MKNKRMLTHKIGVASNLIVTIRIMLGAAIATSKMARLASQQKRRIGTRCSQNHKVGNVSENEKAHGKQTPINEPSSVGTVEDRSGRNLCLAGGRVRNCWGYDLSLSVMRSGVRNLLRNIRTLRNRGLRNSSKCGVGGSSVGRYDSFRNGN
jgi:hypothetical protein